MIKLIKLGGQEVMVNAEIIEHLENGPNQTVVSLVTGNKILVKNSVEEIVEKVIAYHGKVMAEMQRVITSTDKYKINSNIKNQI